MKTLFTPLLALLLPRFIFGLGIEPVTMGLLAGGILSGVGSLFGSKKASKAQEQANAANLAFQRWKFEQEREMRDEDINRAFAGNEGRFQSDFWDFFNDSRGAAPSWEDRVRTRDNLRPSMDAAGRTVGSIFDGTLLDESRGPAGQVARARVGAAQQQGISAREGLQQALQQINAHNARRGFAGGSSFENSGMGRMFMDANTAGANAMSQAHLANAQQEQALTERDIDRRVGNIMTPAQFADASYMFESAPMRSAAEDFTTRTAPANFFRINAPQIRPGEYQAQPVPGMGMAVGSAMQAGGNALSQYFLNQQLADRLQTQGVNNDLNSFFGPIDSQRTKWSQ